MEEHRTNRSINMCKVTQKPIKDNRKKSSGYYIYLHILSTHSPEWG